MSYGKTGGNNGDREKSNHFSNIRCGRKIIFEGLMMIGTSLIYYETLVENKCIPCKDLARSLQNTHNLQDLARKFFSCKILQGSVFLERSCKEMFFFERSYKEMFSLKDLARKCFPCKIPEFNVVHTEKLC